MKILILVFLVLISCRKSVHSQIQGYCKSSLDFEQADHNFDTIFNDYS